MALQSHPLHALQAFLPPPAWEPVEALLHHYRIHLIIQRERKSLLGNYRPAHRGKPHTITVNGNLNPVHFLEVLLHELAHLLAFEECGSNELPHGSTWKRHYATLMKQFMLNKAFPQTLHGVIEKAIKNPAASSCSHPALYRAFRQFDHPSTLHTLVENLQAGACFRVGTRRYKILEKRRTRYVCRDLASGQDYLFPGLYEVIPESCEI